MHRKALMRASSCAALGVFVQEPPRTVSLAPISEKHILHGSKNTLLAWGENYAQTVEGLP